MDRLTTVLAFLATLSLATERITETIKGLPLVSRWLAVEKPSGSTAEEFRKACIHILAIAIGSILAYMTQDQFGAAAGMQTQSVWLCIVLGAMASGGSGMWNSALDIVREISRQKAMFTEQLKAKAS